MMLRVVVVALLGCAAPAHDAEFAGVGEPVPQDVLDARLPEAIEALEACAGRELPGSLSGWTFHYPAVMGLDGRFACGELTECGPLPEGCDCAVECPCRCAGVAIFDTRQIVLASGLESLEHEITHVLAEVVAHSDPIWSRCGW